MSSTESDPPAPGDGYVQSFARGLQVLRSFGQGRPTLTLSEAAQHAGLTRAGARRILLTLQHLGYVEAEGRHFRLTPKVLELGFAYLGSQPVWRLAQPVMEDLVAQTRESCSAAVLDGDEVVYVLRVPGNRIMAINLGVGTRLPAWSTALGRVLLAALPDDDLAKRLKRVRIEPRTAKTITDASKLTDVIADVRRKGYAMVDEELEAGLISLAVAIANRAGRVVAAINISAHRAHTPPTTMRTKLLPPLQAAAQRIQLLVAAAGE